MSERSDIAAGKDRKDITIPRPYQKEIMLRIERTLEKKGDLLVSLATGYGRTATIALSLDSLFYERKISRVLVVTPRSELRDQYLLTFKRFSISQLIFRLDSRSKQDFFSDSNKGQIVITTLAMFRKLCSVSMGSFDIVFFDDCHNISNRDWSNAKRIGSSIVGFTPLHPLEISKNLLSLFGKKAPDYSYGISSTKLRHLADVRVGSAYRTLHLHETGVWRFVRPRDIKSDGKIEVNTFVSDEFAEKNIRSSLRNGDIILQNIFGFGKLALVTEKDLPAIASQNLFIIRSKVFSPKALFEYLQSKSIANAFNQRLEESAKGTTIKHISLRDVEEISVPLPYSENQLFKFADLRRTGDLNALKKARNELTHLKQAYLDFYGSD